MDIWIGLPARQYMRVINLCNKLGATPRSANKVYLRAQGSRGAVADGTAKIEGLLALT